MTPEDQELAEQLGSVGARVFDEFTQRADAAVAESHRLANRITAANLGLRRGRRRLLLVAVFSILLAVQVQDLHVENCAVKGQPRYELQRIVCNLTFPTHQHSPDTRDIDGPYWPGVGLWTAALSGSWLWIRKRTENERRIEREAEEAIEESRRTG